MAEVFLFSVLESSTTSPMARELASKMLKDILVLKDELKQRIDL